MLIKIDYFHKLPECYQNVIMELSQNLALERDDYGKISELEKFSDSYVLIPPLWIYWIEIVAKFEKHEIMKRAVEDFACSLYANSRTYCFNKCGMMSKAYKFDYYTLLEIEKNIGSRDTYSRPSLKEKEDDLIFYLSYPHDRLEDILKFYDEICGGELPKEVVELYRKNKEIYNELINSLNDPIKFFETTLKADDEDSILANVEIILGDHPYSVELWKKCFQYAEKHSLSWALSLYTRYCGIFFNDSETIKKREEIKFEYFQENDVEPTHSFSDKRFKYSLHPLDYDPITIMNFKKPNFENIRFQIFPFPTFMKNYIYEKVGANVILKLQKSAKHFVQIFPQNLIRRLEINDGDPNAYKHGLNVSGDMVDKLPDIWLTNALFVIEHKYEEEPIKIIPILIPKIIHCDLKYLRIYLQDLTFNEFKFFTKSGNIEVLKLKYCRFVDENEDEFEVPVEDVLAQVASVYHFSCSTCYLTPKTAENLFKINLKTKLKYFKLGPDEGLLETEAFIKFLKKNLDSCACVKLRWNIMTIEEDYDLILALKELENKWDTIHEKPYFSVSDHNTLYANSDEVIDGQWQGWDDN